MFKKFSAILLTLSLLLSTVTIGYAADDIASVTPNNEMAAGLLVDLGIISAPDADAVYDTTSVTRAEYLDMLVQVLLKTQVTETKLVNPFDDVYEGHTYFSSICYGYGVSIIDGGETFNPDGLADLEFALNATAGLLGYRFVKTYIPNWTQYISRSDLTENIVVSDGVFSLNDAYTMLYNALGTDCIQLISGGSGNNTYGVVEGETLGSEYFGLTFVSGRVTATEFSSITGETAGAKSITIDGKTYICKDIDRFNLLGMYVDAVVNEGGEIIAIGAIDKDNETIVIEPDAFNEYDGDKITYYKGTALKKINLDNATIIYNGANVTAEQFSLDLFNISEGQITVIKNKNGKADVISIEDYKSFIIGATVELSTNEYEIYASNIPATKVVLDLNAESTIKDAAGNTLTVDDIKRNSLLTYKLSLDGEYIEAIVSNNQITGAATGRKSGTDGLKSVTIAGTTYNVNKEVLSSSIDFSDLQTEYVWYITPAGNIGAVDYSTKTVDLDGYLISAYKDDSGEYGFIKIVDNVNNEKQYAVTYPLRKKVKLDGNSESNTAAVDLLLANTSTNVEGKAAFPILYRVNEEGEVYQIDTPYMGDDEDPKTALQEVVMETRWQDGKNYQGRSDWYFVHPGGAKARVEGKYYLSKEKNLYSVASDLSDVFLKSSVKESSRGLYNHDNFKMYRKGNKTYALNCIVYISDAGREISTDYNIRQYYMVDEISEIVTPKGDITMHIKCIYNGVEKEYDINPAVYELFEDDFAAIEEGDLLRLSFNDLNEIDGAEVFIPYANRSAAAGGWSGSGTSSIGNYYYNAEEYFMFGKVHSIEYVPDMGKYLVSIYTSPTFDESKIETISCNASHFVLYDGFEYATVDPSAIKTYEDFGENCDTMFSSVYYSVASTVMFFKTN